MLRWIAILTVLLLGAGCAPSEEASDASSDRVPPEDIISAVGTVRYIDLEGGFYGIIADDSTRYNPDSLGASLREDGLRVRFRAERREEMTVQMWGVPVTIIDIARLSF